MHALRMAPSLAMARAGDRTERGIDVAFTRSRRLEARRHRSRPRWTQQASQTAWASGCGSQVARDSPRQQPDARRGENSGCTQSQARPSRSTGRGRLALGGGNQSFFDPAELVRRHAQVLHALQPFDSGFLGVLPHRSGNAERQGLTGQQVPPEPVRLRKAPRRRR